MRGLDIMQVLFWEGFFIICFRSLWYLLSQVHSLGVSLPYLSVIALWCSPFCYNTDDSHHGSISISAIILAFFLIFVSVIWTFFIVASLSGISLRLLQYPFSIKFSIICFSCLNSLMSWTWSHLNLLYLYILVEFGRNGYYFLGLITKYAYRISIRMLVKEVLRKA